MSDHGVSLRSDTYDTVCNMYLVCGCARYENNCVIYLFAIVVISSVLLFHACYPARVVGG